MNSLGLSLNRRRSRVVLSLTPLIDVVFILLVFFMLVSQFTQWRQVEMSPEATLGGETTSISPVLVLVDESGSYTVSDETVRLAADAAQEVKASVKGDQAVIVRPLTGATIQPVVSIVEALKASGVQNVSVDRHGAGQ